MIVPRRVPCAVSLMLFIVLTCSQPPRPTFVYIPAGEDSKLVTFKFDSHNGDLTLAGPNVTQRGGLGPLAVDPPHNYLYAALTDNNAIASFKIDKQSGQLTYLNVSTVVGNPAFITIDNSGQWLLGAFYFADRIAIYPIQGGVVSGKEMQLLVSPCHEPHSTWLDETNHYVLAPCLGSDLVLQFKFDEKSGQLSNNTPPYVATDKGAGPRHLAFHPNGKYAYVINEVGSTITGYNRVTQGTIAAFQTVSTLSPNWNGTNAAADVHITPDGKYLYGTNRGNDTIAAYSIDVGSGHLSLIKHYNTEAIPRAFAIDPTGKFIIVAGEVSGYAAVYQISDDGTLIPLKRYYVGSNLMWVLFVTL